ncbi:Repetin, partial [Durusdinium trenchii]
MSFMSHEVSYRKKIEASFSEHLELHHFPLDRQLCRIKLIAESPIEEFQFVIRKKDKPHHPSRCIGTFEVAKDKSGEKIPAIAYVRYCDHECPFPKQRSMVNVLFHLDRKGDYYFNNILILVFLVNVMGCGAFSIPLDSVGDRLSL